MDPNGAPALRRERVHAVPIAPEAKDRVIPPAAPAEGIPCLRVNALRGLVRSRASGSSTERHPLLLLGHPSVDLGELARCAPIGLAMTIASLEEGIEIELRHRNVSCATWRAVKAELGHLARIVSSAALERRLCLSIGSQSTLDEAVALHSSERGPRILAVAQTLSPPRGQAARDVYEACLRGAGPAAWLAPPSFVVWGPVGEVVARLRDQLAGADADGDGSAVAVVSAELAPEARLPAKEGSAFPKVTPASPEGHPVVLVTTPFAPVDYPALGLALLRETLPRQAPIAYLTLPFAEALGLPFYCWISNGLPQTTALLGEWIFSRAGGLAPQRTPYLEEVACRGTLAWLDGDGTSAGELLPIAAVAEILDAIGIARRCLDEWSDGILSLKPRLVGFTSTYQQNCASLALARKLKESRPDLIVVFGGSNWEGEMGLALGELFPVVDASVSGEADHVFAELVRRLLDGEDVAGLPGVRTSGASLQASTNSPSFAAAKIDVNRLPYPSFDDFFEQYRESRVQRMFEPKLLFETARGCWWGEKSHCTFCGLNGASMTFRSKEPRRALDEIFHLAGRYPGVELAAVDNILDMRYFTTVIEELARTPTRIDLFYEVKANLSKSQIELLSRAGIRDLQPGIESLSDHVLAVMGKGITALQNVQLLKWCTEYAILPYWNLIWGFPGERVEDYEEMSRLLPLVSHLSPPYGLGPIRLDRFSPNHFEARRRGFANLRATRAYGSLYDAPPAELDRIAYYFDYDYLDQRSRHVDEAIEALRHRLGRWRLDYRTSRLTHVAVAEGFLVFDSRPCATARVHHLEGDLATIFALCDKVRSVSAIDNAVGDHRRSRSALGELVERGLVLAIGERALALSLCARTFARMRAEGKGGESVAREAVGGVA